jgi:hypothetical protein
MVEYSEQDIINHIGNEVVHRDFLSFNIHFDVLCHYFSPVSVFSGRELNPTIMLLQVAARCPERIYTPHLRVLRLMMTITK